MKVFITVSHTTKFIKTQLKMIRKNLTEVDQIILIAGPFGDNWMTSAGRRVWTEEHAKELDVDIMFAPDNLAGIMGGSRYKALMSWLMEEVLAGETETCLYLQSDCIPMHPLSAEILMGGCGMAARTVLNKGEVYAYPTWFIIDGEANPDFVDFDANRIADLHVEQDHWCGVSFNGHESITITKDNAHTYLGELVGSQYEDLMHLEWCEPGFLHLDKVSFDNDKLWEPKMEILREIFHTEFEEIIPEIEGLIHHNPKLITTGEPKKGMKRPKRLGVPHRGPSLFKMAQNLGKAVVRHVKDGNREVTQEEYGARLSVCIGCEFHKNGRCLHANCGCFLTKKAWWASEDCPEQKWPQLGEKDEPS